MSTGVIYIATGSRFVKEACVSAESVKRHMPTMPITIFCDERVDSPHFDTVMRIERPRYRLMDKVLHMASSPYEHTLFLDTDTYVCDNVVELFAILDKFDLALAHSTYRATYRVDGIPDSFPEFNTGVILFKQSPEMTKLFSDWLTLYERDLQREPRWLHPLEETMLNHDLNDQPTFREAVFHSSVRVASLTPEYNCRFTSPGFVHNVVKILHGRHPNMLRIAKLINAQGSRRVHFMRWGKLRMAVGHEPSKDKTDLFRWSVHHRGVWGTIKVIVQRLRARWRGSA